MSLPSFTTLQKMDVAGITGPFVHGATKYADIATMDVAGITGPFVPNPDRDPTITNWLGTFDSDSSVPANWDNGVPTSSVNAIIAGSNPMNLTNAGSLGAMGIDFSAYTGTLTITGAGAYGTFDLSVQNGGNLTLGAGMTITGGVGLSIIIGNAATLVTAGFQIFGVQSQYGATITLGDNLTTRYINIGDGIPSTLAFGTKTLTVNPNSLPAGGINGITFGSGAVITYSTGAAINFQPTITGSQFVSQASITLPPTTVTMTAGHYFVGNTANTSNWKFDSLTMTVGSIRFAGTPVSPQTLTVTNNMSWASGSVLFAVGTTQVPQIIVNGNFTSGPSDDIGATQAWTLNVTGTCAGTSMTVANCTATGTSYNCLTLGVNGGGNHNVLFPTTPFPHVLPGADGNGSLTGHRTKSPWQARSDYEAEERKKREHQLTVEAEHEQRIADANALIAQEEARAARVEAEKTARVNEFVDALFAPQTKVVTPEEIARRAEEEKALKVRADELMRRYEADQVILAERIEQERLRKEEQRKVLIDAKLSTLLHELEFEQQRQSVLHADDEMILKLIQQLDMQEA